MENDELNNNNNNNETEENVEKIVKNDGESKVENNSEANNKNVESSDENTNQDANSLDKAKEELKELEDRFKRMLAEFENYKKRTQKEKESIYGMVTGDVITTMLPIMDNLEKAADAKTEDTQYQDGVKLVSRQFAEALKSLGLEEIESVGKRFDPQYHEAVSHIEDETKGEQEIVQEYRKGYKIGNKVVRYSMVIVAN